MRLLLTLMAMAVLTVSIGCDNKAAPDAAKKADGATAKKAVVAPAASEHADHDDADHDDADAGETQTVSLKLPGMT